MIISAEQRALDRERGEQYSERWCQDCKEIIVTGQRRIRCHNCGLLVCGWCFNHVHALSNGGQLR